MMIDDKKTVNPWINFLPAWILANGFGWFLISAIYILPVWGVWATVGVGFFLSLFQWVVLQKYISLDAAWLWLSTPVYGIFLYVYLHFSADNSLYIFLLINFFCLGLLGLLQRSAFDYYVDHATVWVIANPLASIIGMSTARMLTNLFARESFALYWALSGIVYSFITGIVIILLRNSTSSQQKAD